MAISPKSILILFIVNLVLALVCWYLMFPYRFFIDAEALWQIPLAVAILSVIVFVLSRIVEVSVNKPGKKYKVYFWGQVLVTVVIFAMYASFELRSSRYQSNQANIDYNKKFVTDYNRETKMDSMRLRALRQLEATVPNRNDIRLEYYNSQIDNSKLQETGDSVLTVHFTYTHKKYPGSTLCSKHIIGDASEELVYYNIPASEMEEVQKYIAEMDAKITEVINYRKNDSLSENERKLLDDALKRIEERKSGRKVSQ